VRGGWSHCCSCLGLALVVRRRGEGGYRPAHWALNVTITSKPPLSLSRSQHSSPLCWPCASVPRLHRPIIPPPGPELQHRYARLTRPDGPVRHAVNIIVIQARLGEVSQFTVLHFLFTSPFTLPFYTRSSIVLSFFPLPPSPPHPPLLLYTLVSFRSFRWIQRALN